MAGKKAQYENALGSIFDFIFKNSNKKNKGLKPVKPTGLSPSNDFAGALAEMAAQPAYYASDGFMGLFDEALNQSLVEFYVDRPSSGQKAGRFRVRPREVLTLLRNPSEYVNKVFQKAEAERKWSYRGLGGVLDTALATYWANKKAGFDINESFRIGTAAGNSVNWDMERLGENMLGENAGVDYLIKKGKIAEARTFSKEIKGLGSQLSSERLKDILGGMSLTDSDRKAIWSEYVKESGKLHRSFKDSNGRLTPTGYRDILSENLYKRASIEPDSLEKEKLMKGYLAVHTWNRLKATQADIDFKGIRDDIDDALIQLDSHRRGGTWGPGEESIYRRLSRSKEEMDKLGKRGEIERLGKFNTFSDTFDYSRARKALGVRFDFEISKVQLDIRKLEADLAAGRGTRSAILRDIGALSGKITFLEQQKNQLKTLPFREYRVGFANIFGAVDYVRSVGSGEFLRGIWNGSWFTKDVSGKDSAPGIFAKYKNSLIVVPKNDLNPLYASLASVYYITPPSILKTAFWNGEFFAFQAWQNQQKVLKKLMTPELANMLRSSGLLTGSLKNLLNGNSFNEKVLIGNFDTVLATISAGGFGKYSAQAKRLLNFHNRNEKLLTRFSGISKWVQNTGFYKTLFGRHGVNRKIMNFVGMQLLKLSKKRAWREAVILFTKGSYGIRQLVGQGIKILLSTLGVSFGGPLGQVLVWLATEVVTRVAMFVAKYTMKIAIIIFLFVLFLIPMLGTIIGIFGTDSLTSAYRHVPPAEALQCVEFNPHSGLYPEPPIGNGGSGFPPIDSTCPLNYSPLYCNQGSSANSSDYHQKTKAIDVDDSGLPPEQTVWYAPSDGRVVSYQPNGACRDGTDYGGTVVFEDSIGNIYKMLHVRAIKSSGSVSKGEAVAIMRVDLQDDTECWTGPHHHLEVQAGGSYQDAYDWYVNKLSCDILACSY